MMSGMTFKIRRNQLAGMLAVLICWPLSGCAPVFKEAPRKQQTAEFYSRQEKQTAQNLEPGVPVSLDRCIDIALGNNLDGQIAAVQSRIATLDRESAFGNFLPRIEVSYSFTDLDNPPMRKAGETFVQASDPSISRTQVVAQMPIFVPQAWFAYDMFRKNEDIHNLIRRRTEQLIRLNVTARYYACLAAMQNSRNLDSAIREAEKLVRDAKAFEREGMIQASQRARAEALLIARQNALADNERALRLEKSGLLSSIGLSPLGDIAPVEPELISADMLPLEDQIYSAMLNRLELHISDHEMALRKQQTRMAIAAFLPNILGIGSFTHDSDSFLKFADTWSFGISGFLTLFDGFQNVFQYRISKEREKEAFTRREQACMMIMLEVIRARTKVDEIEDQLQLVNKNLEAAQEVSKENNALWREGLISLSVYMQSISELDKAMSQVTILHYQNQIALATLLDVMA